MGSSKKGMLNVLIAAVLGAVPGYARSLLCRKARCRRRF